MDNQVSNLIVENVGEDCGIGPAIITSVAEKHRGIVYSQSQPNIGSALA